MRKTAHATAPIMGCDCMRLGPLSLMCCASRHRSCVLISAAVWDGTFAYLSGFAETGYVACRSSSWLPTLPPRGAAHQPAKFGALARKHRWQGKPTATFSLSCSPIEPGDLEIHSCRGFEPSLFQQCQKSQRGTRHHFRECRTFRHLAQCTQSPHCQELKDRGIFGHDACDRGRFCL